MKSKTHKAIFRRLKPKNDAIKALYNKDFNASNDIITPQKPNNQKLKGDKG
jgi:hypothetical protein